MRFELAPGAEMIGWDVLALGLPASRRALRRGRFTQQLELPGVWLERGCVDGADTRLLDSPLGWAGHRVLATMWFAAGAPLPAARRDALLDAARERVARIRWATAGATAPHERRGGAARAGPRVEPAMQSAQACGPTRRAPAWNLAATPPRLWRT